MSKITSDLMWKTSIENYFQEFMEFFAPEISQAIDFEKGHESLNKELAEIVPESEGQNRRWYPTYSIAAQKGYEEKLKQQENPFALVVLAGLYAMESKTDGERRYHFKKELLEKLYEKSWDRKKIVEFFKYLNVLIKLGNREKETELIRGFVNKMEKQGQDIGQSWEWYTTFVEDAREEGIEKGILQTAKNMLKKGLAIEMIAEITTLPVEQIQRLAKENGYQ